MQESTLLIIAMISSILGIIILFFVSSNTEAPEGIILEDESKYTIQGEIKRVTELDKVTFLEIEKQDALTVVLFKDYPVELRKGDFVEVIGQASKDDENEIQLIGKEIRIVK